MTFPRPAVIIRWSDDYDPVTEINDERASFDTFYADATLGTNDFGDYTITWDDGMSIQGLASPTPFVESGGIWTTSDGRYLIRPVDTYDAVRMAPTVGVPQPIDVIRAAILQGGVVLAQELDAVVADDNTVVTLMLETGIGTYVRYSGDWQLLGPDSTSLEDLSLVAVGPGALDVFDAADNAGTTVSVFDLPTPSKADDEIQEPDDFSEQLLMPGEDGEPVTASGTLIPTIASVQDMDLGLRFAAVHPAARWYVTKRAKALGVSERIPASWNVVLVK